MDKQMIEEMAKLVQGDMCGDVPCEECNYNGKMKILPRYCGVYLIAEKLYNAGYRKIPEGAVVVSKQIWDEHIENREEGMKTFEKRVRKETAERYAEKLKNKAIRQQEFVGELAIGDIEYVKVKDIDKTLNEFLGE